MRIIDGLLVALARLPFLGRLVKTSLRRIRLRSIEVMKRVEKTYVRPRNWSNTELEKFAAAYEGAVINVSGWKDEDQTGGHYRDYFSNARGYFISNYHGERGAKGADCDFFLDLEKDVPQELKGRFQVVFNHTTLEHVYDIHKAIANLCSLSNDTVILVTPFLQQVHFEEGSYGDYWRPTPMCLNRMLAENGFEVIYQNSNDNEWYIVYIFTVATRDPRRWQGRIPFGRISTSVGIRLFGLK
jgi:hypothetical protein